MFDVVRPLGGTPAGRTQCAPTGVRSVNESRHDLPRLPQEPRRLRGDAGAGRTGWAHPDQRGARGRSPHRQHVRLHRQVQAGIHQRHPGDGRAEEDRRLPAAGGHRVPRRAVQGRAEGSDTRDRRAAGDWRSTRHRRCARRPWSTRFRSNGRGLARRSLGEGGGSADDAAPEGETRPAWRACGTANLHLRRRDASTPGDAAPLRVRQGRGRLRLHVRVLHHPASQGPAIAAGRRPRSSAKRTISPAAASRNCCSSARTPPSTATTWASEARSRACFAS